MRRSSLPARLLAVYAAAFLAIISVLGLVVDRGVRTALVRDLVDDLATSGEFISSRLTDDPSGGVAELVGIAGGARITIVRRDGVVLADTEEDPAVMDNHGDRPEVVSAFAGSVGSTRRMSATLGKALFYVAVPPAPGQDFVVRLAVPEDDVAERLSVFRRLVLAPTALAGLLGVGLVALVGGRLARPIRALTHRAQSMAGGNLEGTSPESGVAEFADLGVALDRMGSNLQARIADAEEARRELEVILRELPVGVVAVGGDGGLAFANPAALGMIRASRDMVLSLMPHAFRQALERARHGVDSTETVEHGLPVRRLEMSAFGFGQRGALALIVDSTEADRIESTRRDFVSAASHELRTPIAAVLAASEALELALDRDVRQARRFASMVSDSARQLARLASDLLDLSRLEASDMEFVEVDLGAVVSQVAQGLTDLCEQRSVSLRVAAESVVVLGSAADLQLAVRNLLDNAIRYTDAGGSIDVRVVGGSEFATVEVEDTGVGIPSRALPRVFERFYRVDSARSRDSGGTGLGLAIVKHVAERHGGGVEVSSVLGSGSRFTVCLPLVSAG